MSLTKLLSHARAADIPSQKLRQENILETSRGYHRIQPQRAEIYTDVAFIVEKSLATASNIAGR